LTATGSSATLRIAGKIGADRGRIMENTAFGEVLEAVGKLSPDEQETLLVIVRRRLAEQGRKRLAQDVREAKEEFAQGRCEPVTVEDLMNEIRS
jgi:hypothetical protein